MDIAILFEYYNVNILAFQMKVCLGWPETSPDLASHSSSALFFLCHFYLFVWAVVPDSRSFKILFFLHKLCSQGEISLLTASFVPCTTYLTHKGQLKLKSVSKYVDHRFSFLLFIDNALVLSRVWAHGGDE